MPIRFDGPHTPLPSPYMSDVKSTHGNQLKALPQQEGQKVSFGTRIADWLCSKLTIFDKIIPLSARSYQAQTDKALKKLETQYIKSGFTVTPEIKEQCK